MQLAVVNLCAKFEVSTCTRYKAMTGGAENELVWVVRGHSRLSAMSPFDKARTTSYSNLIETVRLSSTVFEI